MIDVKAQREALKKKLAQQPKPAPTPAPPTGTAEAAAAAQVAQLVKFACGCVKPLEAVQKKKCGGCRDKAEQEQRKAGLERREAAKAKLRDKMGANAPHGQAGRLPDASIFTVSYDADTEKWSGKLNTTVAGQYSEFIGIASSVFFLLRELDTQYRAAVLKASEQPGPS